MLIQRFGPTNADGSAVQSDDDGKGVSIQFDKDGNINIGSKIKDGTAANTVVMNIDGSMVVNTDISGDNNLFTINKDCSLEIAVGGGKTIIIKDKDSSANMTLGDGAVSVAIADNLKTFWGNFQSTIVNSFTSHTHPTGVGPSGPPTLPWVAGQDVLNYDASITSGKLKIPNG